MVAEVMRRVFADRAAYLADPDLFERSRRRPHRPLLTPGKFPPPSILSARRRSKVIKGWESVHLRGLTRATQSNLDALSSVRGNNLGSPGKPVTKLSFPRGSRIVGVHRAQAVCDLAAMALASIASGRRERSDAGWCVRSSMLVVSEDLSWWHDAQPLAVVERNKCWRRRGRQHPQWN